KIINFFNFRINSYYLRYHDLAISSIRRLMILSGNEIRRRLGKELFIEPFNQSQLGPNSYNLRLHNELMIYDESHLDMKKEHQVKTVVIPEEGLLLEAGQLYLGRTIEYTKTDTLVPMIEGRSSIGRLGLFIHVT